MRRSSRYDVASVAELLAEPSRAAMVLALLDGTHRPATELARAAGVSASTASEHLARLVDGGMLGVTKSGRHRYYALASADVAHAVETIAALAPAEKPRTYDDALRFARTCYRHLAGRLGVAVATALSSDGSVALGHAGVPVLTARGAERLAVVGLATRDESSTLAGLAASPCLDWTERVHHWAGPLGIALADRFFARRWVARRSDGRALRITARGERGLRELGVRL